MCAATKPFAPVRRVLGILVEMLKRKNRDINEVCTDA
jgi:hypothetical protein